MSWRADWSSDLAIPVPSALAVVDGVSGEREARVVAVPQGPAPLRPVVAYASEGDFQMENLAPGDYKVYAWDDSREVEYYSPAALEALSKTAVAVHLQSGGTERITVKFAPEAAR